MDVRRDQLNHLLNQLLILLLILLLIQQLIQLLILGIVIMAMDSTDHMPTEDIMATDPHTMAIATMDKPRSILNTVSNECIHQIFSEPISFFVCFKSK